MWHDSVMYDVTQTSGMTHLYMTYNYRSLLWNIVLFCRAFQVMTWLENVARRIYIWHDSDIWHDPLKYDMTQKCGTTHSYMIWLQNVAWLIMIWHDSKMRPDSFIYDMTPYGCICRGFRIHWQRFLQNVSAEVSASTRADVFAELN